MAENKSDNNHSGLSTKAIVAGIAGLLGVGAVVAYAYYSQKSTKESAPVVTSSFSSPQVTSEKKAKSKQEEVKSSAPIVVPVSSTSLTVEEEESGCSRAKLILIFKDILTGMETTISNLANEEHQLRLKEPKMADEELVQLLNEKYLADSEKLQQDVFERHGTNEKEVTEALEEHQQDPELTALLDKMNQIRAILEGGQVQLTESDLAKIPEHLTVKKLMELFSALIDSMVALRQDCYARAESPKSLHEVEALYQAGVSEVKERVLAKFEVTEQQLDLAMQRSLGEAELREHMVALRQVQTDAFQDIDSRCVN